MGVDLERLLLFVKVIPFGVYHRLKGPSIGMSH